MSRASFPVTSGPSPTMTTVTHKASQGSRFAHGVLVALAASLFIYVVLALLAYQIFLLAQ